MKGGAEGIGLDNAWSFCNLECAVASGFSYLDDVSCCVLGFLIDTLDVPNVWGGVYLGRLMLARRFLSCIEGRDGMVYLYPLLPCKSEKL
jgi:hypothetical protein